MRKIGLLGGTFDPIHIGHIHIALGILEAVPLDEVWFCPAQQNPHKLHDALAPAQHRLEMVVLALETVPHCHVIDNELKREGPSYMVDTLKELVVEYPDCQFGLIIGEDAAAHFNEWREPETLMNLADVYIAKRDNASTSLPEPLQDHLVHIPLLDISATTIRKRLIQGLYCGHLLPAPVLDYITTHALYESH